MIRRLDRWTWEVAGEAVRLIHPQGPATAVLRYRERIAPIRTVQERLAERVDPTFVADAPPVVTPFVTDEGEYAAFVVVTGRRDGEPELRVLAMVFGDDWFSELAGISRQPDQFDAVTKTVRRLAESDRLMLGHPRRRRFSYEAPRGWWSHSVLPLTASWFPPGYPDDDQLITVYPALPHHGDDRISLDALPIGPPFPAPVIDEVSAPIELERGELVGRQWAFLVRTERGPRIRSIALLRSPHHFYCVFGDATDATLASVTARLATLRDSIEPLPKPRSATTHSAVAHWGE